MIYQDTKNNAPLTNLTKLIKQKCSEAGFVKIGVSKAKVLNKEKDFFKSWLDDGKHANMDWLNKSMKKRVNPKLVMNGVNSVISLAYLYDTSFIHKDDKKIPKISRYAWGNRDYHKIIKKKLKSLCKEIEDLSPRLETKYYVDDGPIMDKVWAEKSGIGWMGKHTIIINPDVGSFFFLSEILINCELEYDEPIENLCENCSICLDACPTGALSEAYKLDSNLCVSYQTVENKDEIPGHINLNNWIFGCDICQDICPFNTKRFLSKERDFFPKENIFNKTYDYLLKISEEEFDKIFEGSAIRRVKYKGWRRNLKKAME